MVPFRSSGAGGALGCSLTLARHILEALPLARECGPAQLVASEALQLLLDLCRSHPNQRKVYAAVCSQIFLPLCDIIWQPRAEIARGELPLVAPSSFELVGHRPIGLDVDVERRLGAF